jgi:lipopolysaccharide transport system permease protein
MSSGPEMTVGEWTIEPRQNTVVRRLVELWQYRRLFTYFASRTMQEMYQKSSLGWLWMILRVTAPIGVNSLIFGGLLQQKSEGGQPYFLFFLCGMTAWTLFDRSLLFVTRSVERNRRLVTKVYFPRLILPLAATAPAVVYLAVLTVVLTGAVLYLRYQDGVWYIRMQPGLLLAAASVVLSLVFAVAVGFWTSVLQARYRDVRYGIRYLMPFGLYLTPVIYPLSHIPEKWRWLVAFNPMATVVEMFKLGTLGDGTVSVPMAIWHVVLIVVTLFSGIWFFNREESDSVDKL